MDIPENHDRMHNKVLKYNMQSEYIVKKNSIILVDINMLLLI